MSVRKPSPSPASKFRMSTEPLFPKVSESDAEKDFKRLVLCTPDIQRIQQIGTKASGYFFKHQRIRARVASHPTYSEVARSNFYKDRIILRAKRLYKTEHPSLSELYGIVRFYHGIASQFRPTVAKYIYQRFSATKVLDPSAGWGDRLVGALATDTVVKYTGIDSNTELRDSYTKMIKKFNIYGQNIRMIYKPSESVNIKTLAKDYDCIFTSPPYFTKEKYRHMPVYTGYTHWFQTFLKPMIEKFSKVLRSGGYFCINIEDVDKIPIKSAMIQVFKKNGFTQCPTLKYILHHRYVQKSYYRYEPIFVFRKK